MALGWGSVISGGLGLLGGLAGSNAQDNASQDARNMLTGTYNNSVSSYSPYTSLGTNAVAAQNQLLGGNYSGFYNSPDYQAAMQSGTDAMDRSAAARGSLYSGGHSADLTAYGQNLATQNLNNYRNYLTGLTNTGLSATGSVADLGQNYSRNYANLLTGQGSNRASSYGGMADSLGTLAGGIGKVTGWF